MGSVTFAAIRVCDSAKGWIAHNEARTGSGTSVRHHTIRSRCVTFGKKSGRPTVQ